MTRVEVDARNLQRQGHAGNRLISQHARRGTAVILDVDLRGTGGEPSRRQGARLSNGSCARRTRVTPTVRQRAHWREHAPGDGPRVTGHSPLTLGDGWHLRLGTAPREVAGANGLRLGPDGELYVASAFGNTAPSLPNSLRRPSSGLQLGEMVYTATEAPEFRLVLAAPSGPSQRNTLTGSHAGTRKRQPN